MSAPPGDVADRLALLALEGTYAATFDSRDGDAWSGLFTEDGSYESADLSRTTGVRPIVGRAALREACVRFPGNLVHILGIPDIRVDGDDATARISWISAVSGESAQPVYARVTHGYYDVEYRRVPEGWAIVRRVSHAVVKTETQVGGPVGTPHRNG